MDVEEFLKMVPRFKNSAICYQISEKLKECHIENYETLKTVPLEDLAAILGDETIAQIIVKEINDIVSFSMDTLIRKLNEIEFMHNATPLNIQIVVNKMNSLHKLANKCRRHINQTNYPMFKGNKELLEELLKKSEEYKNNLQMLCEHLSATTDVPNISELETELLKGN